MEFITRLIHLLNTEVNVDGLLIFVMKDHKKRLVVWNTYCGQHRWIGI